MAGVSSARASELGVVAADRQLSGHKVVKRAACRVEALPRDSAPVAVAATAAAVQCGTPPARVHPEQEL